MGKTDEKKFYGMMNDYMFHLVLQQSKRVLRELVSALMDIPLEEIKDCRVENPIDYGKAMGDKEIVLDVRLTLNNDTNIDIEVQVQNESYWIERSLLYWSRAYDTLKTGEDYGELRTTYHIAITNFTLFQEDPEFYAEYGIVNRKNGRLLTDKFCMRMLDLTRTDLADSSPKDQKLLKWARIFKAKTLPEFETLCSGEEVFEEMAETVKRLSEEQLIRMRCQAREDYDCRLRSEYTGGYRDGLQKGIQQEHLKTEEYRLRAEAEIARLRAELAELKNGKP